MIYIENSSIVLVPSHRLLTSIWKTSAGFLWTRRNNLYPFFPVLDSDSESEYQCSEGTPLAVLDPVVSVTVSCTLALTVTQAILSTHISRADALTLISLVPEFLWRMMAGLSECYKFMYTLILWSIQTHKDYSFEFAVHKDIKQWWDSSRLFLVLDTNLKFAAASHWHDSQYGRTANIKQLEQSTRKDQGHRDAWRVGTNLY